MIPFLKEAVTGLFSKPSTEGYPFTPKEAPEGYRGRIVFHADRCIGCGMCERVCEGGAISTTSVETEELCIRDRAHPLRRRARRRVPGHGHLQA